MICRYADNCMNDDCAKSNYSNDNEDSTTTFFSSNSNGKNIETSNDSRAQERFMASEIFETCETFDQSKFYVSFNFRKTITNNYKCFPLSYIF